MPSPVIGGDQPGVPAGGLAKKGKALQSFKPPKGADRKKAQQEYQVAELERSITYCKETLGLGARA